MTKSILEYKDEQDWYLASFGSYNHLTCFGVMRPMSNLLTFSKL